MYYYGGGSYGCGGNISYYPTYGYNGFYSQSNNNYAIILVLFILLVIVIGARYKR